MMGRRSETNGTVRLRLFLSESTNRELSAPLEERPLKP